MEKTKLNLGEWREFVAKNSTDSYSLLVCLAILELIEYKAKDKDECNKVLQEVRLGLSGAQAEFSIGWYLKNEVDGLPDKEMAEVSKLNNRQ